MKILKLDSYAVIFFPSLSTNQPSRVVIFFLLVPSEKAEFDWISQATVRYAVLTASYFPDQRISKPQALKLTAPCVLTQHWQHTPDEPCPNCSWACCLQQALRNRLSGQNWRPLDFPLKILHYMTSSARYNVVPVLNETCSAKEAWM